MTLTRSAKTNIYYLIQHQPYIDKPFIQTNIKVTSGQNSSPKNCLQRNCVALTSSHTTKCLASSTETVRLSLIGPIITPP